MEIGARAPRGRCKSGRGVPPEGVLEARNRWKTLSQPVLSTCPSRALTPSISVPSGVELLPLLAELEPIRCPVGSPVLGGGVGVLDGPLRGDGQSQLDAVSCSAPGRGRATCLWSGISLRQELWTW